MKKAAFSLVELIFVIILIGVLSSVGFYYSRPDYTLQDAQFSLLKLKEARYRAIGYEGYTPSGCVTLTQNGLSSKSAPVHEIKSDVTHDGPSDTLCFDSIGRIHQGNDVTLSSLIRSDITLKFTLADKNTSVRIMNGTGYAIISCN